MNATDCRITNWTVKGFADIEANPICVSEGSQAWPVNALFPQRQDLSTLTWVYEASVLLDQPTTLVFDGLSPLCEVLCNGTVIGTADNAFHPHQFKLSVNQTGSCQLQVIFQPLDLFLKARQPRPAWKTALANNNLRALRTPLLGAIPGWANEGTAIGLLADARLKPENDRTDSISLTPWYQQGSAKLGIRCSDDDIDIQQVTVIYQGQIRAQGQGPVTPLNAMTLDLGDLPPWWPHTHGNPNTHLLEIHILTNQGEIRINRILGFKSIELTNPEQPSFKVNDRTAFLRGACWTGSGYPEHRYNADKTRQLLRRACQTGFNVIRISGPMPYEADSFYELCTELGLLVWQDFSFANFDYPRTETFFDTVATEARFQVSRLSTHACLMIFCGNSEVEQQGAMVGVPLDQLQHPLFHQQLPELVAELAPMTPYIPSSPSVGTLPFQTDTGFSHYFGYGAYRQPESDLILADVKFASECLGFSHVPDEDFCKRHFQSPNPVPHLPDWKQGITRDAGTGWDFEDIRDHYLETYFQVNARDLRSRNLEQYHQFSRVLTGHMMSRAFTYWRSDRSSCSGGISWWLNDIRPGAGWGVFDSDGGPKPAAHILGRQLQSVHVGLINQGLNGHSISVVNESSEPLCAQLTVLCIHSSRNTNSAEHIELTLPAHSSQLMSVNEVFNRFMDTTDVYRFGAEAFDVIGVALQLSDQTLTDVVFPSGLNLPLNTQPDTLSLSCQRRIIGENTALDITSDRVISFAELTVRHSDVWNNHQTLLPGIPGRFILPGHDYSEVSAKLTGLNLAFRTRLTIPGVAHA